jgi:CRISPR-associated protein Cas2
MSNKLYQPWLVCYDIEDNKTRKILFDTLKDLGLIAVQKSVFWGNLNQAELRALQREVYKLLDRKTDKAFWINANLKDRLDKQSIGYQYFTLPEPDGHDVL